MGWIVKSHIGWLEEGKSASEVARPRRGWSVKSHIGRGEEQTTISKDVETFPYQTRFKALKGSPKEAQRGQYLLAVDLGRCTFGF